MKTRESGMPEEELWRTFNDPATPRGPSMEIRPRPEQCRDWAVQQGFRLLPPGIVSLPPYHYGMTLERC